MFSKEDLLGLVLRVARKWAGDQGVEIYNEDPEASVHERIVVRAHSNGRLT